MKRKLYIFLSVSLIFIMLLCGFTESQSYSPLYCENKPMYDSTWLVINAAKESYRSAMGMGENETVYYICWMYNQGWNYGDGYCWTYIHMSNQPFYLGGIDDNSFNVRNDGLVSSPLGRYQNGYIDVYPTVYSDSLFYGFSSYFQPGDAFLCSSHTITDTNGTIYMSGIEEIEEPEEDFFYDFLEDFKDFTSQSDELNETIQNQTVLENANNPNDGIFHFSITGLSGLQNIANAILQQISNQLQYIGTNTLDKLDNLKDSLLDAISNIFPNEWLIMIDTFYQSGLDSSGNFNINTFLDFWLVPSDDFFSTQFEEIYESTPIVYEITSIGNTVENTLLYTEPKSPVFTIPAGTYGMLILKEPYSVNFNWFISWKPYTDIFIAAFLYVGLAIHLFKHLPGVLNGTGSVASSVSSLERSQAKSNGKGGN